MKEKKLKVNINLGSCARYEKMERGGGFSLQRMPYQHINRIAKCPVGRGLLHIVLWLVEEQSLWVLISPLMSRRGGVPNWRRYSRLNCEGLSYPT